MPYQITVIGLDQTGVSIGMALANHKDRVYRCGHDLAPAKNLKIKSEGAFDKMYFRLGESIRDADCVLLCLPADQVETIFKEIADDLKSGCVVIDTGKHCTQSASWAKSCLPDRVGFINMVPALNGTYLRENAEQRQNAHADLFNHAEMLIATSAETPPDAVNVAMELTSMLGAHPLLTDLTEADGLLARAYLLPKLSAAALLIATLDQPGWEDLKRLASKEFASVTESIAMDVDAEHPSDAILANAQNALDSLDSLGGAVELMKELLRSADRQGLDVLFRNLRMGHAEWLDQRTSGDWDKAEREKQPKSESMLRRLFGDPSKLTKK